MLSLGAGFKKVLAMDVTGLPSDDVIAAGKTRLATVDDDGVTFKSHLDGSKHRFTPEVSMRIQHQLGADIIFAFDECTTLMNTREYQERSVDRTQAWAVRCVDEHRRLTARAGRTSRTRRCSASSRARSTRICGGRPSGTCCRSASTDSASAGRWRRRTSAPSCGGAAKKCRKTMPRHLLGISEPDDIFTAIENGADTFDCVSPSRVARNGAIYSPDGRYNVVTATYRRDFSPLAEDCDCYTCAHYTRAYLHHLFKAKEMVSCTLATIHNERFVVRLVDDDPAQHRGRAPSTNSGPNSWAATTPDRRVVVAVTASSTGPGRAVGRFPLLDPPDDRVGDRHQHHLQQTFVHVTRRRRS